MPLALVLSSYVAAARIGGAMQQYVLAAHQIDPILVPTVVFGRSPARGDPMGGKVEDDHFRRLCDAIEAEGLLDKTDVVITGHFSTAEQVAAAAELIAKVRQRARAPIVVDPILGDEGRGLYVREPVEAALRDQLVPLADWITPNLWELQRLSGEAVAGVDDAVRIAGGMGRGVLLTSVPAGPEEIGALCHNGEAVRLFFHRRLPNVSNGTGDLVAAAFGAALVHGLGPFKAAKHAVMSTAMAVEMAESWNAPELPVVALGARLAHPEAELRIEDWS